MRVEGWWLDVAAAAAVAADVDCTTPSPLPIPPTQQNGEESLSLSLLLRHSRHQKKATTSTDEERYEEFLGKNIF